MVWVSAGIIPRSVAGGARCAWATGHGRDCCGGRCRSGFSRELFVARMTTIGFTRRMQSSRLKPLLQELVVVQRRRFCECHHRRRTMRAAAFPPRRGLAQRGGLADVAGVPVTRAVRVREFVPTLFSRLNHSPGELEGVTPKT